MARGKYKCQRCKEYVVQHEDDARPVRSGAKDFAGDREGSTMWECDDAFCPFPLATAPAAVRADFRTTLPSHKKRKESPAWAELGTD